MGNETLKTDKCQLSTVNSQLRDGYKQSEVGVIPVEWVVETLGDIFTFGGGYSASRDQLSSEGYCYLHYGDIHKSTKSFIDVRAEYSEIPKLNILLKRISPKSLLHNGDIVFVDASEDDEGTSKHIVVVNNENITYISGLHTIVAKSKVAVLDNEYKRYCFQSRDIKKQFYFYAVETKVSGISKTNIAKLKLPIPPLPEQQAIASALSDVDALITALEQLITKKRNIKQGAMQQLLTGEKRLPGFGGVWEVKNIGDFASATAGGTPSTSVPEYWNGDIRWMSSGELNLKKVYEVEGRITEIGLKNSSTKIVPPKCVLIGLAGQGKTRGTAAINYKELCTNQSIAAIFPNDSFIPEYLFYNLYLRYNELRNLSTGDSGRGGLNLKIIKGIPIPFPTKKEQQAIAQILSDMDTEIEALEQKRFKYKAIKQGMMQELLTGKRRLA